MSTNFIVLHKNLTIRTKIPQHLF